MTGDRQLQPLMVENRNRQSEFQHPRNGKGIGSHPVIKNRLAMYKLLMNWLRSRQRC